VINILACDQAVRTPDLLHVPLGMLSELYETLPERATWRNRAWCFLWTRAPAVQ
jgi:hypothetical protein